MSVLGLPLAPTVGIAGALALIAGGTAAAAAGGPLRPGVTTSLASGSTTAVDQDNLRQSAAGRPDRTRTSEASAAAAARTTADERAAWVEKTTAAQRALGQKLSSAIVDGNEVDLTASTLASKMAAAAAKAKTSTTKTTLAGAAGLGGVAAASTTGRYVLPVSSGVDRDTFGMTGPYWAHRHTGQDFPVPLGTAVVTVSSGKVLETGWAGAFGNRMRLLLDDGTEIWYCHLSSYVATSGRVSAGQVVARSGSTGNSTGPHLHMEVHLQQNPVASDPLNWLRSKGLKI